MEEEEIVFCALCEEEIEKLEAAKHLFLANGYPITFHKQCCPIIFHGQECKAAHI